MLKILCNNFLHFEVTLSMMWISVIICVNTVHCVSKKLYPFYFCKNFFIHEQIFIIFGSNMLEEICNKTYIVFPTTLNLCSTLPCNMSSKSD